MSERKYTAQEMRDAADFFDRNAESVRQKVLSNSVLANIHESTAMLRQAADDAEELAQLKARLDAVVKLVPEERFMCVSLGNGAHTCSIGLCESCDVCPYTGNAEANHAFDAILSAARGEGGAE